MADIIVNDHGAFRKESLTANDIPKEQIFKLSISHADGMNKVSIENKDKTWTAELQMTNELMAMFAGKMECYVTGVPNPAGKLHLGQMIIPNPEERW